MTVAESAAWRVACCFTPVSVAGVLGRWDAGQKPGQAWSAFVGWVKACRSRPGRRRRSRRRRCPVGLGHRAYSLRAGAVVAPTSHIARSLRGIPVRSVEDRAGSADHEQYDQLDWEIAIDGVRGDPSQGRLSGLLGLPCPGGVTHARTWRGPRGLCRPRLGRNRRILADPDGRRRGRRARNRILRRRLRGLRRPGGGRSLRRRLTARMRGTGGSRGLGGAGGLRGRGLWLRGSRLGGMRSESSGDSPHHLLYGLGPGGQEAAEQAALLLRVGRCRSHHTQRQTDRADRDTAGPLEGAVHRSPCLS